MFVKVVGISYKLINRLNFIIAHTYSTCSKNQKIVSMNIKAFFDSLTFCTKGDQGESQAHKKTHKHTHIYTHTETQPKKSTKGKEGRKTEKLKT